MYRQFEPKNAAEWQEQHDQWAALTNEERNRRIGEDNSPTGVWKGLGYYLSMGDPASAPTPQQAPSNITETQTPSMDALSAAMGTQDMPPPSSSSAEPAQQQASGGYEPPPPGFNMSSQQTIHNTNMAKQQATNAYMKNSMGPLQGLSNLRY